jgi:hypothetical protein
VVAIHAKSPADVLDGADSWPTGNSKSVIPNERRRLVLFRRGQMCHFLGARLRQKAHDIGKKHTKTNGNTHQGFLSSLLLYYVIVENLNNPKNNYAKRNSIFLANMG